MRRIRLPRAKAQRAMASRFSRASVRPMRSTNRERASPSTPTARRGFGERTSLGLALRGENFEDFGTTVNGKVTLRYDVTPAFAVRGSASNGFRAPSLHQKFFNNISTQFDSGGQSNRGGNLPQRQHAGARAGHSETRGGNLDQRRGRFRMDPGVSDIGHAGRLPDRHRRPHHGSATSSTRRAWDRAAAATSDA